MLMVSTLLSLLSPPPELDVTYVAKTRVNDGRRPGEEEAVSVGPVLGDGSCRGRL
jgi:hypothetical protein